MLFDTMNKSKRHSVKWLSLSGTAGGNAWKTKEKLAKLKVKQTLIKQKDIKQTEEKINNKNVKTK